MARNNTLLFGSPPNEMMIAFISSIKPACAFLDLDARIVNTIERADFELSVCHKLGNAFSYLPYGSFHARHVFRLWLKAEVL
jgi:hypothetical protein